MIPLPQTLIKPVVYEGFCGSLRKMVPKSMKSIRFRRVPRCTSPLFKKNGKAFEFMVQIEFCAVVI